MSTEAMVAAASLDDLVKSAQPAWLWDGERARVVWANAAGIAFFGCETVFDVIEIPFDAADPAPARLADLTASLGAGETVEASLLFTGHQARDEPADCLCSPHGLGDGRRGLLVRVVPKVWQPEDAPPQLMTGVLSSMPIAVMVCDLNGQTVYCNRACEALLAPDQRATLQALLDQDDMANDVLRRLCDVRSVSRLAEAETVHGRRQLRLTGRRLPGQDTAAPAFVLFLLEDVTDRRRLEKSLSSGTPVLELPKAQDRQPADSSSKPAPLSDEEEQAFSRLSDQISAPGLPAPPVAQPPAQATNEDTAPGIPDLVRQTLDQSNRAVLLHQNGVIRYGNRAALALFGHESVGELASRKDLGKLVLLADGTVTAETAGGRSARLTLTGGRFPWPDGSMRQSVLVPASDAPPEPGVTDSKTPPEFPERTHQPAEAGQVAENRAERSVEPDLPKQAPAAADATDTELRAILDTATDGIVTLDQDGRIISISAGAEAAFGYRLADVAGKPFADLLTNESRGTFEGYLAGLKQGGVASVFDGGREVTGVVNSGGELPLFVTMGRLGESARSGAAFCVVLRDITHWKKTEADLRRSKLEAERSSELKSEFLANISHELRTPLNAILGFSDVMRTQRFGAINNDKYLAYANDIHASGGHLLSLINDMLDLSKIEAGKHVLNFQRVNLAALIEETMRQMQEQATQARVVLRKSVPQTVPDVVADERSMRQILLNLFSNGIKFTDPGGQVIVSLNLNKAGELVLRLKDTGIGMSEADLDLALQPFQRVAPKDREGRPGTGLGLPLTKALTEANRARFEISSEPKKGTLVEVVFPVNRVLAE